MASLKFSFMLSGFVLLYMVYAAKCEISDKLVGGSLTTINRHKHIIYIRENGLPTCAGALIDPLHVVIAANCVLNSSKSRLTVHGGTSFLNLPGVIQTISNIYIPGGYDNPRYNLNIAVLKLSGPLYGRNIRPIRIYPNRVPDNAAVQLIGWGTTNVSYKYPPYQLRKATLRIINTQTCQADYSNLFLTSQQFCAGIDGVKGACRFDYGAPLEYRDGLAGIVSIPGCAVKADIYTSMYDPTVRQFIARAQRL